MIDNWGLVHALFHHSPVLVARPRGWRLAEDRSLSELEPAPIYEELWRSAPRALFDLMVRARCRPVRQWAVRMLRRDPAAARAAVGLEEVIGLLGHDDPEVVAFAVEWLRRAARPVIGERPSAGWRSPSRASPESRWRSWPRSWRGRSPRSGSRSATPPGWPRAVPCRSPGSAWAGSRPGARPPTTSAAACSSLLEAESEPLRPEILAWLRSVLASAPEFHAEWLLEFLDSRHADARAEGMSWFRAEPRARDDVMLWQRLMESPHDDVRLAAGGRSRSQAETGEGRRHRSTCRSPWIPSGSGCSGPRSC